MLVRVNYAVNDAQDLGVLSTLSVPTRELWNCWKHVGVRATLFVA